MIHVHNYTVPCLVVSCERAVQISLAESSGREKMHPADEFDAFGQLIGAGQSSRMSPRALARHHLIMQRRLKLANVCPAFVAFS